MTPEERKAHETTLDPDRQVHVGIWRDEYDDIAREFYSWTVPELSPACAAATEAGVRTDVDGLGLAATAQLLEPGYLPLETGIARSPDGELCIAVLTKFPAATPAMLDWWMGWHIASTERYKLWHPQAHLFAQPKYALSDLPGLSDRERYLGNTSWVDEYVGPFASRLAITFHDPAEVGLPYEDLEASGHGTALCAVVRDSDNGVELSRLIHAIRATPRGCEMRSRFIAPPGSPELVAAPLLDHCYTEMTHLGSFLPRLYARVTAP